MAMANYCLNNKASTDEHMLDAISGNICRCTGYVTIIKAAKQLVEKSQAKGKKFTLEQLVKHDFIPSYFIDILNQLKQLKRYQEQTFKSTIVAGGTDLYVQRADDLLQQINLRYITQESSEEPVVIKNGLCSISGTTTVSDLFHK